jgi:hypothetical protein
LREDEAMTKDRTDREALLRRIWEAQAEALAKILETTPPEKLQAATLNVARQFLADNGVRKDALDTPERLREALGGRPLPFRNGRRAEEDEEEGDGRERAEGERRGDGGGGPRALPWALLDNIPFDGRDGG